MRPLRLRPTTFGVCLGASLWLAGAAVASAFIAQPGFSATTAATGFGIGPAGIALLGPVLYAVDPGDGGLYRSTAPGPAVATRLLTLGGSPTGIVAAGGQLYVTRRAAGDLIRVDPVSLAVTTVTTGFGDPPGGIAADAAGDLYVAAGQFLWRIATPAVSPAKALYPPTLIPGPPTGLYGITVSADNWIYAIDAPSGHIWRLEAPARLVGGALPAPGTIATFVGGRGIAAVTDALFITSVDGSITKLPIAIPSALIVALTGGGAGDLATIGTDGCYYASQGPAVVRLAKGDGTCDLATAAPPPPPPTLTLANTSALPALLGDGDQTFTATLANATVLGGVPVTFTLTRGGVTVGTATGPTAPNGIAGFSYRATSVGTDTLVATAVVSGIPVTSNPVVIDWPRAIDTALPRITYAVTAASVGANFSCPNPALGTPGLIDYCGWYTSPPTVHWTITATGPTGLRPGTACPDFTLTVSSPVTGTPVNCPAFNGDGRGTSLQLVLQSLIVPPSISARATTAAGPYVAGTPTSGYVTVTFTCMSDPVLGSDAIRSCGPDRTIATEGSLGLVTGTVLDIAGTTRTASFGPILIDKTPPVVTATMRTATDGRSYVPGTPTTQDVIVTFACTDNLDPAPLCPAPVRVSTGPSVTVSASDWAGNSKSYTFGGINIDRVAPVVTAAVSPPPDPNGNNSFTATVNVTAFDPSGIRSITYSATGAQPIPPTTVTAIGSPATFSVAIALKAVGTTVLTVVATDGAGNVSPGTTVTVKIVGIQRSTLVITSPPTLPRRATLVTAKLTGPGAIPIAGRTVTFIAGRRTATGTTNASGVASATLALNRGTFILRAAFAGDPAFSASSAQSTLVVTRPKDDDNDRDNDDGDRDRANGRDPD